MIPYDSIIRQVAIRLDALTGTTTVTKEAAYVTSPLTATQIGSVDFPFTAIKDAVLSAEARIVRAYANLKNHPFRTFNLSQTAGIAHKAVIPSTNSATLPIIGVYGAIRDATTGEPLTEAPKQTIETLVRSKADGSLRGEFHHYKVIDGRLYHTRASAVIDVNTFDLATERTKMATVGGLSLLPDATFDMAWAAALALLIVDDAYASQAGLAESYVQSQLSAMANGAVAFLPAPSLIGSDSVGVS